MSAYAPSLAHREAGGEACSAFRARVLRWRRQSLALCGAAQFERAAPRGVGLLCLELDSAEQRLLLAGAADGSVALFDTGSAAGLDGGSARAGPPVAVPAALRLRRGVAHAHGCSAAAWYPAGGGLCFTAGLDGFIKAWDLAAGGAEALRFSAGASKVYALALPRSASAPHGLLAAGVSDGRVLLCDPAAGGAAHVLTGHRAAVLCAAWLPASEHVLATGGADGAVRLWDVRTAGTLLLLDQHRTAEGGTGGGASALVGGDASATVALAGAATAHTGSVSALCTSSDGRVLYSHGGDGRVRAWCAARGVNLLLHFPAAATPNAARLGTRLALSGDGAALYVPARSGAAVLCARTGDLLSPPLQGGHFADVVAAVAHPTTAAVFTAAQDGTVLTWAPRPLSSEADDAAATGQRAGGAREDADAWSDEEEAGRGPRMAYRPAARTAGAQRHHA